MKLTQHAWKNTHKSKQLAHQHVNRRPSRMAHATSKLRVDVNSMQRQISLLPESPNTNVRVLDLNGDVIASLRDGARNAYFTGRGDISAIIFTVNNETRACDLGDSQEWLQSSEHIGLRTKFQHGAPTCTLENMDESTQSADIFGSAVGNRCVYMSDQKGSSGFVCN